MLKKLLILALTLNTSHILPSDSSSGPVLSLKAALGLAVPGMVCTWIAVKTIKEQIQASNEVNRQVNNLRDMGAKVDVKNGIEWIGASSYRTTWSYNVETPSSFSSQQKEQAQKCFELLSTNLHISTSESGAWIITMSAIGGFVLLTPITSHIQTALTKPSAP